MQLGAQTLINCPPSVAWEIFINPATWSEWWGGELSNVSPGWQVGAELIWKLGFPSKVIEFVPAKRVTLIGSSRVKTTFLFTAAGNDNTLFAYQEDYSSAGVSVNDPNVRQVECDGVVSRLKKYIESRKKSVETGIPTQASTPGPLLDSKCTEKTNTSRTVQAGEWFLSHPENLHQFLVFIGVFLGFIMAGALFLVLIIGVVGNITDAPENMFDMDFFITYGVPGVVALLVGFGSLRYYRVKKRNTALTVDEQSLGLSSFCETNLNIDWPTFASDFCTKGLSGEALSPQVIICCRSVEMAKILSEQRPKESTQLLRIDPDVIQFRDNKGAVRFEVKGPAHILDFCKIILDGKDYAQPLSMTSVIIAGAPDSDKSAIVNEFGAPRATSYGEVFMW